MKNNCIIFLAMVFAMPLFAQRLNVITHPSIPDYRKHYSHIIDAANINDSLHVFIAGNYTDRAPENEEITGHKISGSTLITSKRGLTNTVGDKILLTDFSIDPSSAFQYAVGTGIYYPTGSTNDGYPFIGLYNKATLQIEYFYYYNLSYAGLETSHATGLRIVYSREERAFYICGVMADRRFYEININDIDAKTKGFILKVPESGSLTYSALVFSPDAVLGDGWLCSISDLAINEDETKIAFTGLNTKQAFTGYHHPMSGVIDMDLNIEWCKTYEIESVTYAGVDVLFNESDTTLFVLHNSTGNELSVMEISSSGAAIQGPIAYKFTNANTSNDTTKGHMMHYYNDTLIITGNHFAEETLDEVTTEYQYLYRIDLNADSLLENYCDFTYYSKEVVPPGKQKIVYSYWAPENSVYMNNNLNLVGVFNDSTSFGFTHINVNGISENCVHTFDEISREPHLDDTVSCTASTITCTATAVTFTSGSIDPTNTLECVAKKSSVFGINDELSTEAMWEFEQISQDGIEMTLISESSKEYSIQVYDIMGRQIYSSNVSVDAGETSVKLKFEVEAKMYIVKVNNGTTSDTKKFINLDIR
jgi:hypothetical protein